MLGANGVAGLAAARVVALASEVERENASLRTKCL